LALFQELRIYLDTSGVGAGVFDPTDTLVRTLSDFNPDAEGVISYQVLSGRVAHGAPKTYFVVVEMTTGPNLGRTRSFEVTHRTSTSSTARDYDHPTVPLTLEFAADVSSGRVDTDLYTFSCQAPFDLNLTNRTVSTVLACTAGTVIRAGTAFVVGSSGDLRFHAGMEIELADDFSVETGGGFTAEIDPALEP
jgi:hypothetical protein